MLYLNKYLPINAMKKANILTILLLFSLSIVSLAQQGTIRGTVIDHSTGGPLIGVAALIEGTSTGAVSDFDGKFEMATAPGNYNVRISYVGYASVTIKEVTVSADQVTVLDNIQIQEDVEQLVEFIVTAEMLNTTEEALLTVKRKSANLLDGISSANFRKIGDSDAAAAIKRVPGVSIEDGKYVYVRGLGDRYTKSTLNSVDIPGLDPNRNTIQMDMFPTSLLDNIIVYKSFTADLPADFTGGIVDITTKDFPDEKTMSISASAGYNPHMHLNNNYLTYAGGGTDFLGFDDGTREIPTSKSLDVPQYARVVGRSESQAGHRFRGVLDNFNPTLAAMRERSAMDFGLGFNWGNQLVKGKNTVGYIFSLVYKNETEFYQGAEYGRYGKGSSEKTELEVREFQKGDFGINNVSLSGLAGIALKRDRSKYKLNLFHSQNGTSKAGIFTYENSDLGANFTANQHNLEYSERSMTNILLNGVHYNTSGSWEIEWKLSPTRSHIEDPDIRYTRIRTDGGNYSIGSESGYPERIWRFLEEDNLVGNVDATKEYNFMGKLATLKFGGGYTYKQRDYEIQNFQIIPQGVFITGNPDQLFQEENLWPTNASASLGTRYEALFLPNNPNQYNANAGNAAIYISNEFNPGENLKAILGIRAENYVQHYTGRNQQGLVLNNEKVLGDMDFFPSVNLIYALAENQNLRFSYSKTIARPSFKEASFAEILDPLTGRTFIGGFFRDVNSEGEVIWDGNLTATRVNNFDLRWELFQRKGQTIGVSGFYKTFDNPIEIVQYVQAPNNFQARNVGNGQVMGIELELRQNLGAISGSFENFSINGNFTFTESQIAMSPTEYESREKNERIGETIVNTRDMAGQAPYIINAGLSYQGQRNGIQTGIYYNVQGETLQFVGIADKPDVYSLPFHSLNFNASRSFGKQDKMRLGIGLNNILGDVRESVFQSFGAKAQMFESINPRREFMINFGFSF
jgi:TonB-dependent receptor